MGRVRGIGPAVALLLAASLAVAQDPVLDPATLASPSGRYVLSVSPADAHGRTSAQYRMVKDGEEVWARSLPFALWDAVVADTGHVAGYAYPVPNWSPRGVHNGFLQFVIMDPAGEVTHAERHKRVGSRFLHAAPVPVASGLILDDEHDRVVVRIADEDINRRAESWWSYRISTGKPIAQVQPLLKMRDRKWIHFIVAARPLRGAPLTLVQWWRFDHVWDQMGTRFTLVDRSGRHVWTRELKNDYEIKDDEDAETEQRLRIWRESAILDVVGPRQFLLHFVKDRQRVEFAVSGSEADGWSVEERGRTPHEHAPPVVPKPAKILEKPLRYLGAVPLDLGSKPRLMAVAAFHVTNERRVFAMSRGAGAIHGFGSDGTRQLLCVPKGGDFRSTVYSAHMAVDRHGAPWVEVGTDPSEDVGLYLAYSKSGERLGLQRIGATGHGDPVVMRAYFRPDSDLRWIVTYERVVLAEPDGTVVRAIEKRPDGNWLRAPYRLAVAPDGSIALQCHDDDADPPGGTPIHLYSSTGEPIRTVHVGRITPESVRLPLRHAFDGTHLVGVEAGTVVVYSADGTPLQGFRPPESVGKDKSWKPFIVADGTELVLAEPFPPAVHRFALRE